MRIRAAALAMVALALAIDGIRAFAQAQAATDAAPVAPGLLPDGWPGMVGSVALALAALGQAWVTSDSRTERRRADAEQKRADRAEAEIREKDAEIDALQADLKAAVRDRDEWMRRAYRQGFKSSDDIPTRGDRP